jgi:hypothetical protein
LTTLDALTTLDDGRQVQYEEVANKGEDVGGNLNESAPHWGALRAPRVWAVNGLDEQSGDLDAILSNTGGLEGLAMQLGQATRTHLSRQQPMRGPMRTHVDAAASESTDL